MLACLPHFIVDYTSRFIFHIQFMMEDFASFQPMHYLIIAFAYILFFIFGTGIKGLTGITLIVGNKSTREDNGSINIEIIFLLLSIFSTLNFFSQGFRKYDIDKKEASKNVTDIISKKRSSNLIIRFFQSLKFMIKNIYLNISIMSGNGRISDGKKKHLYIWYYHPFLKNIFILFNPLQIALFMIQKRSPSIPMKIAIFTITIIFTFLIFILITFFERKSFGEKNLAAEVMQVQQDFFVKWHQARRMAEREVVKELINAGEFDSDNNRLSNISNISMKFQASQNKTYSRYDEKENDFKNKKYRSKYDDNESEFNVVLPKEPKKKRDNPFQKG